jgi:hypothetical protein
MLAKAVTRQFGVPSLENSISHAKSYLRVRREFFTHILQLKPPTHPPQSPMPPRRPPSAQPQAPALADGANANPEHSQQPAQKEKRKRRTQDQIAADNLKLQLAREAKAKKKEAGIKRIAQLEEKIVEDEANDVTPKPKPPQRRAPPLRRTSSHAFIPLYSQTTGGNDHTFSEPLTEQETDNATDIYEQRTEAAETTDAEKEQPPKKKAKQKQPKPKARDAIKAARLESAAAAQSGGEDNESVSSNAVVANGNQKSGLVFPFSYTPLNHAHARRMHSLLLFSQ